MRRTSGVGCVLAVVAVVGLAAGCGGGDERAGSGDRGDDAGQPTPETAGGGGSGSHEDQARRAAEDTRRALAQLNQGKDVKAVDAKALRALLPEKLLGAPRSNTTSQSMGMGGVVMSVAEAHYYSEDDTAPGFQLTVTDVGNLSGAAGMGYAAWATMKFERETDTGYEKTTTHAGHPAHETYDRESRCGQLSVIVAQRFVVKVDASDATVAQMHAALDAVDLKKLAALGAD
jgi:hypothetical protein